MRRRKMHRFMSVRDPAAPDVNLRCADCRAEQKPVRSPQSGRPLTERNLYRVAGGDWYEGNQPPCGRQDPTAIEMFVSTAVRAPLGVIDAPISSPGS